MHDHLENFLLAKTAFHPHACMLPLAPTTGAMEGEDTQDRPTGLRARSPADTALRSLLHIRGEGERQIKAVPSSTALQIKSEVPPSEH